jgi:hypothetical protein
MKAGESGKNEVKSASEYHPAVQEQVFYLGNDNLDKLAVAHGLDPKAPEYARTKEMRNEGRHQTGRQKLAEDITAQMGDDEKINIGRNAENLQHNPDMASKTKAERAASLFPRLRGPVDEAGNPSASGGSQAAGAEKGKELPTGDDLVKKYGESSGDPAHTTFVLKDGRGVANTGADHDTMLGGRATDKNPPREKFVADGNIRVRPRTGAGREVSLSIPESGINTKQLAYLQKMAPQLKSGAVLLEVGKPGGEYRILSHGEATPEALEKSLKELAPIHEMPSQATAHNVNGGSTFHPTKGDLNGTKHFAVGGEPEFKNPDLKMVTDGKELTPAQIDEFSKRAAVKAALEKHKDASVGTWYDKDTGKTTTELVKTPTNKAEAIKMGTKNGEKAIYDLANGKEIKTGGTGEAPDFEKFRTQTMEKPGKKSPLKKM